MQNVAQGSAADNPKIEKVNVHHDIGNSSSTPHSTNSSPAKSETETYSEHRRFMSDSSESEEDSVSEEFEEDPQVEAAKFLLSSQEDRSVDPETQARLEALLKAAGIGQLATKDGKHLADPEVLRRLTSSVSCALDEAAAALTRMRSDNPRSQPEKTSLVEACTDGDVGTVRKLLTEGRSVHETSEEGESLLSLACSAGYFELAQVLLAMHANVEDRGIKGECTPLMEAASAGHLDIVRLLVAHGADVNAQSTSGNTPLMYGCAGGHQEVVKFLLENGANVEDHNENGHTPLMEAASAGHVGLAKILLEHGAGINTHSNEFKESALTLACYKGHLDMVRFLLEAGADQEHKTDEMHTALMEASMDGHVEVARLLLDSGAQVNMPTDSFESPLTLAACGGHVDLAMLLIERGANIEEVNDEGYTPLMEAAREGHEEMVALLLSQGANINAQTDETQETALTLACCGGFTEVADFLIKAGAHIERGASTPLMEAAQEGHMELVKYLLENNADVHAQTQTGDTALTYACENGHTDVADLLLQYGADLDLLLQYGADLEHESEGGRTPLMKACRAGHLCTVQFLISKGADVRRQTTNNDHTPLSLACAGGHLSVVELLLAHRADPNHKLKDNSTMLIEAAKGGHTSVVQLLLDYPHSMMLNQQGPTTATNLSILPGQVGSRDSPLPSSLNTPINFFQPPPNLSSSVLQEVPEAVRIISQDEAQSQNVDVGKNVHSSPGRLTENQEAQQVRSQPLTLSDLEDPDIYAATATIDFLSKEDPTFSEKNGSIIDYVKRKKQINMISGSSSTDEGSTQKKQQILEELHRVDREFHGKQQSHSHLLLSQYGVPQEQCTSTTTGKQQSHSHLLLSQYGVPQEQCTSTTTNSALPHTLNIDIAMQQQQGLGTGMPSSMFPATNLQVHNAFYTGAACLQSPGVPLKLAVSSDTGTFAPSQGPPTFYFAPLNTSVAVPLSTATTSSASQPIKLQTVTSHADVSQSTAISDRPKAKPVSKKEGKSSRKQLYHPSLYGSQQLLFGPQPLQQQQPQSQSQQQSAPQQLQAHDKPINVTESLNVQGLDLDSLEQDTFDLKDDSQDANMLTASILQQFHSNSSIRAFVGPPSQKSRISLYDRVSDSAGKFVDQRTKNLRDKENFTPDLVEDVVQSLESYNITELTDQAASQLNNIQVQSYPATLDETMIALTAQQELSAQSDVSRVEYFAVPTNGAQLPVQVQHTIYPYEHYLQTVAAMPNKEQSGAIYQAGFQAGINLMQQQLACPNASSNETLTSVVPTTVASLPGTSTQQYIASGQAICGAPLPTQCTHAVATSGMQSTHHCQVPCSQHHQTLVPTHQQQATSHQVQAATQTPQTAPTPNDSKRQSKSAISQEASGGNNKKKGKLLYRHHNQQAQQGNNFQQNQNYQIDPNTAVTQYGSTPNQACVPGTLPPAGYGMDVDSETESNHDTALTLACAGGHEELVELLLQRGADIEHRDKKGFTPLILAATAGHEKVVEILLNHNADIEAQSERTKDTPLSLACSGGRYEVVELLLNRNANKEHRNVSDYTPLSLAASGGYVNIIKLLLNHGAEINSRTGSKLGISPLMLAAMNGHTAAVKLLLDMGSDINAQIETNRNTALTLACFQGRHEVVSLLLDRKANVEHRAKTGLTPLMEAASGGYVEVGRVLLDKGADVNATPVPSSRDTALTIAADKGHVRFVELLLCRGAAVEVKNKKGNSPLWLAANGGHLSVVELLYNLNADIDSQDNRKVSCLMAAFRKGHVKVVKWMVNHVTQFPSDQEMMRYISTVSDKELQEKCQECVKIIRAAKETQAAKANKNASILLEELDKEKNREESKKAAAARRRERKKKKKLEKKEEKRKLHEARRRERKKKKKLEKKEEKRKLHEENKKNENYDEKDDKKSVEDDVDKADDEDNCQDTVTDSPIRNNETADKEEGDSGIDANSQGSCSSNEVKSKEKRNKKKKKTASGNLSSKSDNISRSSRNTSNSSSNKTSSTDLKDSDKKLPDKLDTNKNSRSSTSSASARKGLIFESTRHPAERDDFEATGNETYFNSKTKKAHSHYDEIIQNPSSKSGTQTSPKQAGKRDEGWKEVVRKSSAPPVTTTESGVKKVSVPLNAISRVIGRAGSNINAIRGATGAHIEVEKQSKGQGERIITIKGTAEAMKQAHSLIAMLIKDSDVDILQMLPKPNKAATTTTTLWDKTQIGTKKIAGKSSTTSTTTAITNTQQKATLATSAPANASTRVVVKPRSSVPSTITRPTAPPRLLAQAEKNAAAVLNTKISQPGTIISSTRGTTKVITTMATQTFAAKLTETTHQLNVSVSQGMTVNKVRPSSQTLTVNQTMTGPISPQTSSNQSIINSQMSPKHHRPSPTASAPPTMQQFSSAGKLPFSTTSSQSSTSSGTDATTTQQRSATPVIPHQSSQDDAATSQSSVNIPTPQQYSLFNSMSQQSVFQQSMLRRENESQKQVNFAAVTGGNTQATNPPKFIDTETPPVDAAKAPGYRVMSVASPVSSKTSSNSTTPPNISLSSGNNYQNYSESKSQPLPPIGSNIIYSRPSSQSNQNDISSSHFFSTSELPSRSMQHLTHSDTNLYKSGFFSTSELPSRSMQHLTHSDTNLYKSGNTSYSDTPGILSMASNEAHLLQPFHHMNSMQHLNFSQPQQSSSQSNLPVTMSRLNPKAPDFSSSNVHNMPKQSVHLYNGGNPSGYPVGNQNNSIYTIGKPAVNFHRTNMVAAPQNNRWQMMPMQPFSQQQSELISGMAGMTIHNIARATGEVLENGELNIVNNSPAMSPSLPTAHLAQNENHYMEERKQPQPIGTERARKAYPQPIDNNWMMNTDPKVFMERPWVNPANLDRYPMQKQMYSDDIPPLMDTFQHGVPLESPHTFSNGAQYQQYYLQQQMGNLRTHDFAAPDQLKMGLSWEASRPNISDIQDKQQGWSGLMTNKWNP
ncbi:Ankyrin repeats (3 copies) [Popillia japonica]|uniref:Ankyrin repeats (3 copies) n=1 Tax=Popillia japonica TaxID=7064 RepID=A0AAW1MDI1_POPJA